MTKSFGSGVAETDTVPDSSHVLVDGPSTPTVLTGSTKDNFTHLTVDYAVGVTYSAQRKVSMQDKMASKKTIGGMSTNRFSPLEMRKKFMLLRARLRATLGGTENLLLNESEEQSKMRKSLTYVVKGVNLYINST